MRQVTVTQEATSTTEPGAGSPMMQSCRTAGGVGHGVGNGCGRAVGRARVVTDPTAASRVEPGEVLVVAVASPAYAAVLPRVRALVSEQGGALCALATLAREQRIPVVVGVTAVTRGMVNGAAVAVDADAGVVRILQGAAGRPSAHPARRDG